MKKFDTHSFKDTSRLKNLFFLAASCLFFNSLGQHPDLGTCSSFAIFTSVGAIDNTGMTTIYGDVGTNSGAFNGFPPGIIYGNTHIVDSISAKVAEDVELVYAYLSSLSCGSTIPTNLGENQVLTPNTFCLGAASTLGDTLILDGQNNSDTLFIFKINGAFSVYSHSVIILINQAQATNVFWHLNGLFTLGSYSKFKGTVINDGAINLLSNSEVEGQTLSRAGAISLASDSKIMKFSNLPLPIEVVSFTAVCSKNMALLKWQTASESNNDYFSIEKSFDNQNWTEEAQIDGAGNSTELQTYSCLITQSISDKQCYFRLKQTDFDGQYSYSPKIVLDNCVLNPLVFQLFPNPANKTISIYFSGDPTEFISMSVTNSIGKTYKNYTSIESEINLENYAAGTYFFRLNYNDKSITKKMVVVN